MAVSLSFSIVTSKMVRRIQGLWHFLVGATGGGIPPRRELQEALQRE
jgi:hypothetical protein